jgi:hypothetical protein
VPALPEKESHLSVSLLLKEDAMKRFLWFLAILICAMVAQAQNFDPGVKLVYRHRTGTVESQSLGGKVIDTTEANSGKALEVRGAQTVGVWIADPNPVLFTYTWNEITFEVNADYAAAEKAAKAFQPVIGLLGKEEAGGLGADRETVTDPFAEAVEKLKSYVNAMPGIAAQTCGTDDDVKNAKNTVGGWKLSDIQSVIEVGYAKVRKGDFTAFTTSGSKGSTDVATDVEVTSAFDRGNKAQTAAEKKKAEEEKKKATEAQKQAAAAAAAAKADETNKRVVVFLAQENEITKMLTAAGKFKEAVTKVNVPYKLGEVAIDIKRNPTAHITVGTVKEFDTVARNCTPKIGDVSFPMRPYYPAHFSVGPTLVYSFVKAPKFTTKLRKDDGKYDIIRDDADYRGTNVSAMLSITPRSWSEPTLGGSFQIGLSPVKDQIGFFGGGQIRIADLIALGLGYAYQQVPKLNEGLNTSTPIVSPNELKTTPQFRGGFYLAINLTLPKP